MPNGWPINIVERREEPLITRDFDYENKAEDPHRKIEDTYYIYTAFDGINAMGSLPRLKI
jgi:hypothetical protein